MAEIKQSGGHDERIAAALAASVQSIYINGFAVGLGAGDVIVTLERNGQAVATLNMSYTVAKTLVVGLGTVISTLEGSTGRTMLTTNEVDAAITKIGQEKE